MIFSIPEMDFLNGANLKTKRVQRFIILSVLSNVPHACVGWKSANSPYRFSFYSICIDELNLYKPSSQLCPGTVFGCVSDVKDHTSLMKKPQGNFTILRNE